MSSFSNVFENDLLLLYFNNTNAANIGDATGLRGSTTAGSLYLSLHNASPGEAGSQTTNECSWTSYARLAVARSGAGWTVSTNTFTNAAEAAFAQCTGGSDTVKFFGVGRSVSGAGTLDWYGPLTTARFAFTFDVGVDAAADKIVAPGHNFLTTTGLNQVVFVAVGGTTLPTGISPDTIYFVKTSTTDSFTISATDGGSTLNITSSGSGFVSAITPLAVSNGITARFAAGTLNGSVD